MVVADQEDQVKVEEKEDNLAKAVLAFFFLPSLVPSSSLYLPS
jgi:hypothetical protein